MKWKIIAVAVVLLILAQIIFGGRKTAKTPSEPAAAAAAAGTPEPLEHALPEASAATGEATGNAPDQAAQTAPAEPPEPPPPLLPSPEDVTEIAVGDAGGALRLVRGDGGWILANRDGFPADEARIGRLLATLLESDKTPVPSDAPADTGLENGGGLPVALTLKDGSVRVLGLGLRPAGSYREAYVRLPDGETVLIGGDARGDLGLWRNAPDALPRLSDWIEKQVLAFDPEDATRIEAGYPDHRVVFEKSPEGAWRAEGHVPGGDWSGEALSAWLRDLADFRIAGIVAFEEFPEGDAGQTHSLAVALGGGETKTIRIRPNHGGEGMLAATSDHPGRVFHLPEWRFRKHFHRLDSLFPRAVPHFDHDRVRFIDISRDGEKVKIARRDDGWQAIALPYALRPGQADRLARLLSSWRPEEYAAPDVKAVRPNYGAPMVEIALDGGEAHQYRLAGRHPLFPWRYVALDGKEIFSVTDAEAWAMFPEFADILDLGRVFHRMILADVDRAEFTFDDDGTSFALVRNAEGSWSVSGSGQELEPAPDDVRRLLGEPLEWRVTGFHHIDSHPADATPQCGVCLSGPGGMEQSVVILRPGGRDIPYRDPADNAHGYRIDRVDFQNWLAAAREVGNRLEAAAERARAAAADEADETEIAEEQPAGADGEESAGQIPDETVPDATVPDEPVSGAPEGESPAEPEQPAESVADADAAEPEQGDSPEFTETDAGDSESFENTLGEMPDAQE